MTFQPAVATQAKTSAAPRKPVEEYVQERISLAADKGFSSTNCWMDEADVNVVTPQLTQAGYTSEPNEVDGKRVQLKISW